VGGWPREQGAAGRAAATPWRSTPRSMVKEWNGKKASAASL
jgi:hypothetical protein